MSTFHAIGIMSGTSLDGIDLAFCSFSENKPGAFEIVRAQTIPYTQYWSDQLQRATQMNAAELVKLNTKYALHVAEMVDVFRVTHMLPRPNILAFHGHTLFHRPDLGFTFQLGSGSQLATATGIPTVSDFRSGNVTLGGQGAPLVPIGDAHLFSTFGACLNLGGFGNISLKNGEKIIAFDICPVNMALNEFAQKLGAPYDKNGEWAANGSVHQPTLDALNTLDFYHRPPPKSMGREWYEECLQPILHAAKLSHQDTLATYCEHIAVQVGLAIPDTDSMRLLVTGGGAHNQFLVDRIRQHTKAEVEIPDPVIVDFKEALIFAYMGWLRYLHKTNCLSNYTGSSRDLSAGSLHLA